MPLLVADQRSKEWFAARLGRVTASLAAACLELNPYASKAKAWREILGTEPKKDNQHTRWGTKHEADAVRAYEVETGSLVTPTGFWVHPVYDWLGASPDGIVGDFGLVECKCPSVLPTTVPAHHLIQCQIALAVTGQYWCDYFAWAGDGNTFLHRVERLNTADEYALIARLKDFYDRYVVTNLQPPRKRRAKRVPD